MTTRASGLTRQRLNTLLNAAVCDGYVCFAFQISTDGRWLPGVSIIMEGEVVAALDINVTFASHDAALAFAYFAAVARKRGIVRETTARPISRN